jgi:hypothetical protein
MDIVGWGVVRDCCSCGSRGSRTSFDWSVSTNYYMACNERYGSDFWMQLEEGGSVTPLSVSAFYNMVDRRWTSNGGDPQKYRQNLPCELARRIDEVGNADTITKPRELEG